MTALSGSARQAMLVSEHFHLSAWMSEGDPQNKVSLWAGVKQGLWGVP